MRSLLPHTCSIIAYNFTFVKYFLHINKRAEYSALKLFDEHSVTEGEEAILLVNRCLIRIHNVLLTAKGADKHDQGALGQVEVGDKCVNRLEFIAGIDENCGLGIHGMKHTVGSGCALKHTAGGCTNGNDSTALGTSFVNLVGHFL